jgi:Protein of unknown function (DUF3551)
VTGRFTRGFLLALPYVAIVLAIGADPAATQERPWCLGEPGAGVVNCGFYTFAQCQASRPGGSTLCVQNPAASSTAGPPGGRERRK